MYILIKSKVFKKITFLQKFEVKLISCQQISLQIYIELQIFFTQMFSKDKSKESSCVKVNGLCRNHLFELKNLNKQNQSLQLQGLECCPIFSQRSQQFENIFPTFNFDQKYYTPAFVLEIDKHFNMHNQIFEKDRFDRVVEQKLCQNQKFNFNPPFKSNQYCHVCKKNYDDYFGHINESQHKLNLRKSPANTYIDNLSSFYKEQEKLKRTKIQKETLISKINRTSARLRNAQQKKKEKQQGISEISTMTTQKQLKCQEQDQKIKYKRNKIISKIDLKSRIKRRN